MPAFVGGELSVSCILTGVSKPGSVSIVRPSGPAARCAVGFSDDGDSNSSSSILDYGMEFDSLPENVDNATDAGEGAEPDQNDWWLVSYAVVSAAAVATPNASHASAAANASDVESTATTTDAETFPYTTFMAAAGKFPDSVWPPPASAYSDGCDGLAKLTRRQRAIVSFRAVGGASDEMAGTYSCSLASSPSGLGILARSPAIVVTVRADRDESLLLPDPLTFSSGQLVNVTCSRNVPRACDLPALAYRCGGDVEDCPQPSLTRRPESEAGGISWLSFVATPQWHGVTITCNVSCQRSANVASAVTVGRVAVNYILLRNDLLSVDLSPCDTPAALYRLCDPEALVVLTCSPYVLSHPAAEYRWHALGGSASSSSSSADPASDAVVQRPLQNWTVDGQVALPAGTGSAGAVSSFRCIARNAATGAELSVDVDLLWKDYGSGYGVAEPSLFDQMDFRLVGGVVSSVGALALAAAGTAYYVHRRKLWCFRQEAEDRSHVVVQLSQEAPAVTGPLAVDLSGTTSLIAPNQLRSSCLPQQRLPQQLQQQVDQQQHAGWFTPKDAV